MTRKGSRARTPRPRVVYPSYEPPQATWRKVRKPVTSTTFLVLTGVNVAFPFES